MLRRDSDYSVASALLGNAPALVLKALKDPVDQGARISAWVMFWCPVINPRLPFEPQTRRLCQCSGPGKVGRGKDIAFSVANSPSRKRSP
jgi:hypothetical protein